MEVPVRRQQLLAYWQPTIDATVLDPEDLHADETGELPLADPGERLGVYLPATDDTYLATAAICLSVSVPLKAGMIPPPTST